MSHHQIDSSVAHEKRPRPVPRLAIHEGVPLEVPPRGSATLARLAFVVSAAALLCVTFGAHVLAAQGVEKINVDALGRLPAFSHATRVGDLVFVSGTLGTDAGTFDLVPGGTAAQTRQTLRNIERILAAAGATLADVAKCNVYLVDMATFDDMNTAYIEAFEGDPPARTTAGVRELALGAAVEIECIAGKEESSMNASNEPLFQESGFVENEGERIYYEVTGDGTPLVLSHGYGGNHAIWFQQVPVLAREYRVITWDQRGFGRTTNTTDKAEPEAMARDLTVVLDALGVASAHLVGQSMGGWTSVAFALENPERVRSLVLADTIGGLYTEEIRAAFRRYLSKPRPPIEELAIHRHPALGTTLGERDPVRAFLYRQIGSVAEPPPASAVAALRELDFGSRMAELALPILVVAGSQDEIFQPEVLELLAGLLPDARYVELPNAGHSPYFETPDAWNREVLGFLRAQPAAVTPRR